MQITLSTIDLHLLNIDPFIFERFGIYYEFS